MSARELAKYIGREGLAAWLTRGGTTLRVPVKVLDARTAFGREDVQITPLGGKGSAWVSLETVDFEPEGFVSEILP